MRPLHGKRNWQVWCWKFWHFVNPEAFVIEDSRVDAFFRLAGRLSAPEKCVALLERFRECLLAHEDWLPALRAADGGLEWSDIKLWDKVCYGLLETAAE